MAKKTHKLNQLTGIYCPLVSVRNAAIKATMLFWSGSRP